VKTLPDNEQVTDMAKTLFEKNLAPSYDEALVLARKFLEMDEGTIEPELRGKSIGELSSELPPESSEIQQNEDNEKMPLAANEEESENNNNNPGLSQVIGQQVDSETTAPLPYENSGENQPSESGSEGNPAIVGDGTENEQAGAAGIYAFVRYYEGIRLQKTDAAFDRIQKQDSQQQPQQEQPLNQDMQQEQQSQSQQSSQPQEKAAHEEEKKEEASGINISDFFNVKNLPGKHIPK
jgi:hypothetical protein